MSETIVIVGAGHSGARAAHALRKTQFRGRIVLLGNEETLPYDRPPLSKAVLLGEKGIEQCQLYSALFFAAEEIEIDSNAHVESIDRQAKHVRLSNGQGIGYTRLLLATGSEPRALAAPGGQPPATQYLRTTTDALRVRVMLVPGRRIVVVGAGFIGLEIAACAAQRGCAVDVVEYGPQALARTLPSGVSERLVALHKRAGVRFHFNAQVLAVEKSRTRTCVRLSDLTELVCDDVVAGIGVTPRVALAQAAGLQVENGIAVDEQLRTSDPDIFAIGDACSFPSRLFERRIRLESWKNAEDQARVVAVNLLGGAQPYVDVPWFWSNQFDVAVQVSGLPALGHSAVSRPLPNAHIECALDERGVLVGVSAIGPVRDIAAEVRAAQHLIARKQVFAPALLADPSNTLKQLAAAAPDPSH